jgi:hypothetical protein
LQYEVISVAIDDDSGETVAFAPDDATQFWIDVSSVAIFGSLSDAAPKKIQIKILPAPGETARHNLRFGIVNGAPDQMVFAVLE